MKVLLISENRSSHLLSPFPLGLAFLSSALRRAGHEVAVLDFMFLDAWQEALKSLLAGFQPDVVGLSIRNIDNQDMGSPVFFLDDHRAIVNVIRTFSSAPVILGGSGFGIHPAGCLRYLGADFGIYGEGEEAFPRLLETIRDGGYEGVPGAVWRRGDGIVVNRPGYITDADLWVSPAYDDFDVKAYHEAKTELPGCITVQSKRGCHMKCIYCSTPFLEGRQCRWRDPGLTVGEMAALCREREIRRFYVVDNVFNFPPSQAKDFCRRIIGEGIDVSWQAIVNPAFADEELFELMGRAGCRFISLGNEAGHDLVLRNLRKGFTLRNIKKAAALARSSGIRFACFLLLGGPGETRETVTGSVEFMDEISPDLVMLKAGIRIYPGTELERIARSEGMIPDDDDLLHPSFYLSPAVSDWVREYLDVTIRDRGNWKI